MSVMLRYVKHLRRLNGERWRIVLNQPHIKITGVRPEFCQTHSFHSNVTKSYAIHTALQPEPPHPMNDLFFQKFEMQINRHKRIMKSDIEKALNEVQSLGTISSLQSLLLIRSCGRLLIESDNEESIQLVNNIWETLIQLNVPMDVSHYNALLNVYLEKEYKFKPSQFIKTMLENSIEPNRVTYQRLIAAYCQQGDIAGATKILEIMKNKELPLCENVFNSLIVGYSEANDMENALGILKTMENSGILPSANTYGTLLCAYAKRGDMNAVKNTIDNMNKAETALLSTQLMEIFYALVANGHAAAAEEFCDLYLDEVVSDIDVSRISVKLINVQAVTMVMKLLDKTSKDGVRKIIRSIFVARAAVKNTNLSADEVINLCKYFDSAKNYDRILRTAVYYGLLYNRDPTTMIKLLKAWQECGYEIRDHYFWPLLRSQSTNNNFEGIMNILRIMIDEFKISPSIQTFRDYVIPYASGNWKLMINELKSHNIPLEDVYTAMVSRLLFEKKSRNVVQFMSLYPSNYSSEMFIPLLTETYIFRHNADMYVTALRLLNQEADAEINDKTSIKVIDDALLEIMRVCPSYRYELVDNLLHELVKAGLTISPEVKQKLEVFLHDSMSPSIAEALEKLSSGTLEPVPMSEYNIYHDIRNKDSNITVTVDVVQLRRLFSDHLNRKNTEGIIEVLKNMEIAGYSSGAVYAQAIDHFCNEQNVEAAEECIDRIKNMEAVQLDNQKIIKFANLLVIKNRFDDALNFLSEQENAENNAHMARTLINVIRDLFDNLVQTKNPDMVNKMFHTLKSKNFISIDTNSLAPLIKVHLANDDLEKALDAFERMIVEYRSTPCKNILMKKFIIEENANSLQRLTDLCIDIYGEANILMDLALAFLECDRVRQAQKIIETSNIQVTKKKISNVIEHLIKYDRYESLENLITILRSSTRIDRQHLFDTLLNVYVAHNDWKKALGLWTEMQESDVQPTPEFLDNLGQLLMKNNQEIPFVQSPNKSKASRPTTHDNLSANTNPRSRMNLFNNKFIEAIAKRDYDSAEKIIANATVKQDAVHMYGKIIIDMLNNDEIDRAIEFSKKVINNYSDISMPSYIKLVDSLIETNRMDDIEQIGNIMGETLRTKTKYEKSLSKATIKLRGIRKYFDDLKSKIPPENMTRTIESQLSFGAMVHGLIEDPSYLPEFEQWAKDMIKVQMNRPIQVLWNYYFIRQSPEANVLWKTYVCNNSSPIIRPIIDYARKHNDLELITRLHTLTKNHSGLSIQHKCRLASGLIDIYNNLDRYDDALKVVNDIVTRHPLKMLQLLSLKTLKAGLERNGKSFPFKIIEDENFNDVTTDDRVHMTKL